MIPDVVAVGLDWGGMGGDPLAIEVGAKVGRRWLNCFEVYENRIALPDLKRTLAGIVRRFGPRTDDDPWTITIWAGQEQAWVIRDWQAEGLPILANHITGPGSVEYGHRVLYSLIKRGMFANDPVRCPRLAESLVNLEHLTDRTGVPRPGFRLKHDWTHAPDAVRYYLTGAGETVPVSQDQLLLDEPTMWVDSRGRWHQNQPAVLAQQAQEILEVEGSWWDEYSEPA